MTYQINLFLLKRAGRTDSQLGQLGVWRLVINFWIWKKKLNVIFVHDNVQWSPFYIFDIVIPTAQNIKWKKNDGDKIRMHGNDKRSKTVKKQKKIRDKWRKMETHTYTYIID